MDAKPPKPATKSRHKKERKHQVAMNIKSFNNDDYTYDPNQGWILEPENVLATGTETNLLNEILALNTTIYNMAEELRTINMFSHLDIEDIIEEFTDKAHKKDQQ